jgi:hypothetical protein
VQNTKASEGHKSLLEASYRYFLTTPVHGSLAEAISCPDSQTFSASALMCEMKSIISTISIVLAGIKKTQIYQSVYYYSERGYVNKKKVPFG